MKPRSMERQEGSASLQPACVLVTDVKGQWRAGPSELRHKPLFTALHCHWLRQACHSWGPQGDKPLPFLRRCLWAEWVMFLMSFKNIAFITLLSNIYSAFLFYLDSLTKLHYVNKMASNCNMKLWNNFYRKSWKTWKQTKFTL